MKKILQKICSMMILLLSIVTTSCSTLPKVTLIEDVETKITRLETIAEALEQNDLDLEKSLALFEEGMKLVKECGSDLDGVEEKVTILTADNQEMPYEGETEE